jgi:phosphoribosylformylglycinamidine synthase
LGWPEVSDVRVGKAIYLDLEADSESDALERARAMCRKLLANPVTEDFEVAPASLDGSALTAARR